ncbi:MULTISPECIES: hypothetical protein [Pseudocitrobacter]|uniref:DKNYY family protein n=1 Tax=Pseudocitrobacter faecalis TaxID=1398493 RepID=A0ABX9FZ56_9ENTR|nr:hypothetical protein [Pseudocitrobacter sp. RIT 415]RBP10813.1 hypothetical protein DFQ50_105126 [Pseudocitrobacter faecalis]
MSEYHLSRNDPPLKSDEGSGPWCSMGHFTDKLYYYEHYLKRAVDGNLFLKYRYPYAQQHLMHYFNNTGEDLHVDLSDIMQKSSSLRDEYQKELNQAIMFCRTLPPGEHYFASKKVNYGDFISNNADLFYAIGGYQYWGKGYVVIKEIYHSSDKTRETRCRYNLKFKFNFFDRYNWNVTKPDAGVRLGGYIPVTDSFMGQFHQGCLAREYNIRGVIEKEVSWDD